MCDVIAKYESCKMADLPPCWIANVLPHLSWRERVIVGSLNRAWRDVLNKQEWYWNMMCRCLQEEEGVYLSADVLSNTKDSQLLFKELWRIRKEWNQHTQVAVEEEPEAMEEESEEEEETSSIPEKFKFKVSVLCRVRPKQRYRGTEKVKVTIPLHQRLALIKVRTGAKTTSEALKVLAEETNTLEAASRGPWHEATCVGSSSLPVTCAAVQKENESAGNKFEEGTTSAQIVDVDAVSSSILTLAPGVGLRRFHFHKVMPPSTSQEEVYSGPMARLVTDFLNGVSGAAIVYGQTGSGKTHTMFGESGANEEGLVLRASKEISSYVKQREESSEHIQLRAAFVEIFGDRCHDLLNAGADVGQSQVAGHKYVLEGHVEREVNSFDEIQAVIKTGNEQKRLASTQMNERSSRAHSLFILHLYDKNPLTGAERDCKLLFVDLGGSEKLSKSGVHSETRAAGTLPWSEYYERRKNLNETININVGLFALKKCVNALNERQEACRTPGAPLRHIPYYDSKLTIILSEALGGSARTVFIVTIAEDAAHVTESLQSLRFGESVALVEKQAVSTNAAYAAALREVESQISHCRQTIETCERWETKKTSRIDFDGTVEWVTKSILVGAEIHHDKLQHLFEKREHILLKLAG